MKQRQQQSRNTKSSTTRRKFRNPTQRIVRLFGREEFGNAGVIFPGGSASPYPGIFTDTLQNGFSTGSATDIQGVYVPISPGTLAVRLANLSDCYTQSRLRRAVLRYRPFIRTVDATNTTAFNNSFGVVPYTAEWTAAVGWVEDPIQTYVSATPSELMQSGAKWVDMGRPWSLTINPKRKEWKYQSSPSNVIPTPSSDWGTLRTMFNGNIVGMWKDGDNLPATRTGTLTNALYVRLGSLEIEWAYDFQFPIDPDLTGPTVSLSPSYLARPLKTKTIKYLEKEKQNKDEQKSLPPITHSQPISLDVMPARESSAPSKSWF